jgi:hypothetical protein
MTPHRDFSTRLTTEKDCADASLSGERPAHTESGTGLGRGARPAFFSPNGYGVDMDAKELEAYWETWKRQEYELGHSYWLSRS